MHSYAFIVSQSTQLYESAMSFDDVNVSNYFSTNLVKFKKTVIKKLQIISFG
jgi:hypothetical protein